MFERGREYSKVAQAFNGLYLMINDLEAKVMGGEIGLYTEFMAIAYLIRKEVLDRTEKYRWGMTTSIMVPTISRGTIDFANAFNLTVIRFLALSEEIGYGDEMNEMLDKGKAYYEFESVMPSYLKNLIH